MSIELYVHEQQPVPDSTPAKQVFAVRCSRVVFASFWAVFSLVHVAAAAYYAGNAWIYHVLPTTYLAVNLDFYNIWRYQDKCMVIAIIQGIFAALHVGCICQGIRRYWSWKHPPAETPAVSDTLQPVRECCHRWCEKLIHCLSCCQCGWVSNFMIDGKHFEVVLLMQELVEVAMRSSQVYRLSESVPRQWLIIVMTTLLIINCWSTSLAMYVFATDVPRARFWSIMADSYLDFVVAIILPIILALPYFELYDPVTQDISTTLWYDEKWFVRIIHELRLLLIGSPWALISNIFFSVSTLFGLDSLKSMLVLDSPDNNPGTLKSEEVTLLKARNYGRLQKAMRILITLWGGALVVILFTSQFAHPSSPICPVQVQPWLLGRPTCILIKIDCQQSQFDGSASALTNALDEIEPSVVTAFVVRHCPLLEVPTIIQEFDAMVMFKIHNSTITRWDSNAAFTNQFHPKLMMAFFVAVNFTEFPLGLQSADFPTRLTDIEFAETNLTTIPDKVADIWPSGMVLVLEKSGVKAVPDAIVRLNVMSLSLCGNELHDVPAELFTQDFSVTRWLNGNPLSALPSSSLEAGMSLKQIRLANTTVSTLPPWIDHAYFDHGGMVTLGGSPFCENLVGHSGGVDLNGFIQEAYFSGLISCKLITGDEFFYYPSDYEAIFQQP